MKPVLDWVSPLQPDATDISGYSERVANALAGRYRINAVANIHAAELSAYDFSHGPFFNLGNDRRYHQNILRSCLMISGIIVAHDFHLQDLIVSHVKSVFERWEKPYTALMLRHYGTEGAAAARQYCDGKMSLSTLSMSYPGIEIAAENALCMITHNVGLAEEIADRTGLYCASLPLPYPVIEQNGVSLPERTGNKIDLLAFGYIGLNRGLDVLLDLVSERKELRLHIAGQVGPPELQDKIAWMKSTGHSVVDHGFSGEQELDELVRRCDLVANLRKPSMGEVSGSQLRIFANMGLAVVCNTGWYANLPDDTVVKVDPENIKADLSKVLDRLISDRQSMNDIRRKGYDYAKQNHSLANFADKFELFFAELPEALYHGRRVQVAKQLRKPYERANAEHTVTGAALLDKATEVFRAF